MKPLAFLLIIFLAAPSIAAMHDTALLQLVENRIKKKKNLNISLRRINQVNKSLLCLAAEEPANLVITLTLLEHGADPNFKAKRCRGESESPLHAAICDKYDLQTVQALLARGANPNEKRAVFNYSQLHKLCSPYYFPRCASPQFDELCGIIVSLLKHGANPNSKDCEGETPLFWLLRHGIDHPDNCYYFSYNEKVAIIHLLIKGRANVYAKNDNGKTALEIARESNNQWTKKLADNAERLSRRIPFKWIMLARKENPGSPLTWLPKELIKIIIREVCK